jgi:DNA-binding transcriptional MerR regulator
MTTPYSLKDLARLTGIPARSIRGYIQQGVLESPRHAGPATSYDRETLGLLGAIRHARREHGAVAYVTLKAKLRALDADEIEAWAEELDPLPAVGDDEPTIANTPATPPVTATSPSTGPLETAERWVRVPLVPGLELMMLEGSGELVSRLAREIQGKYRATGKSS